MTSRQIEVSDCCGKSVITIPDHSKPPEGLDVCSKCETPCEVATIDLIDCLECGEECFIADMKKHTITLECTDCDFQYQIIEEGK